MSKKEEKRRGLLRFILGFSSGLILLLLIAGSIGAALFINWNKAPAKYPPNPAALPEEALAVPSPGGRGITWEYGEGAVPESVLIEIAEGESSYSVGRRLEAAGIIKNKTFWNLLSRFDGAFVKAGTYRIPLPASQTGVRAFLIEGRQILVSVTIPEGVTLKKTAAILENSGICGAADFIAAARDGALLDHYGVLGSSMEGYLYPDTYFFPETYPAERVVRAMADTFFAKTREIEPRSAQMSPQELERIVIIASIVEREYRVREEAPVMAGVFYNRIGIGMALQSCATVEYIITDIQGKPHPKKLFFEDIEIKHPYNTYVVAGLPPGPISLPGKTALDAAFHPSGTDYLYFRLVNEAAGKHYFSRTNDEHIRAGELFVKGY